MANNALLDEVMEHIEAHKELWHQGSWFRLFVNGWSIEAIDAMLREDPDKPPCGTAGCFAGNACLLSGYVPAFSASNKQGWSEYLQTDYVRLPEQDNGDKRLAYIVAQGLLGIDTATGTRLFDADNNLDDLREMVAHIKAYGNLDGYVGKDQDVEHDTCYDCGGCITCSDCDGNCTRNLDLDGEPF